MFIAHITSSTRRTTPDIGPNGQVVTGASVRPNFHIPTPRETAEATPAIESIQSSALSMTPGTISIVIMKSTKMSVATADEIQYTQNRVRLSGIVPDPCSPT